MKVQLYLAIPQEDKGLGQLPAKSGRNGGCVRLQQLKQLHGEFPKVLRVKRRHVRQEQGQARHLLRRARITGGGVGEGRGARGRGRQQENGEAGIKVAKLQQKLMFVALGIALAAALQRKQGAKRVRGTGTRSEGQASNHGGRKGTSSGEEEEAGDGRGRGRPTGDTAKAAPKREERESERPQNPERSGGPRGSRSQAPQRNPCPHPLDDSRLLPSWPSPLS